ncbi:vanadium-dependent haloperoxidase [Salipaludibacillus sp. HK11]|uniref:vanadium-dependent haloperoxidase n=1 Tax=Salipaludibacillus sp. HK11 TaxID=3394320 RepID=UPI0039FC22E4
MKRDYLKWSKTISAGESYPPKNPVSPFAGSWSLFFLKRDNDGAFTDPKGKKLRFPIKNPRTINFEKELTIVQHALENLTPIQKKIAIYYGTGVPTKQWSPVIDRLIDTYGVNPPYSARILANVQGAINDTMVVVWHFKYLWDVARPNQYDQSLRTLICTPNFPSYPSGHASMSACAEVILSYYFPKEAKKLRKISKDDANGRLYSGVHFPIDNRSGAELGWYIGNVIVQHLNTQEDCNKDRIDKAQSTFLNADIFPNNYEQFIPYNFTGKCPSLLLEDTKESNNVPKPLLLL